MADFHIKKGDRLPSITAYLTDEDGVFDLTGATVAFKMQLVPGGGGVVTGAATVVSTALGQVRYDWGAADTTTVGVYSAEWVVTIAGKERTFPADGFFTVEVEQDVS